MGLLVAIVLAQVVVPPDDGPPMDGPYTCDPVCVHYTCTSRCAGHTSSDCYRACVRDEHRDCNVCSSPENSNG